MKHGLLFFFFIASVLAAQEELPVFLDETRAILLSRYRGESPSDNYLINKITYASEALTQALSSEGLSTIQRYQTDDLTFQAVQRACERDKVRWALIADTDFQDHNLIWYLSIYDALEQGIRAQDVVSFYFVLGIYTDDAMGFSCQRLVEKWKRSFQDPLPSGDSRSVQVRQRFLSPQDGVTVFWGKEARKEVGYLQQGSFIAPLTLFPEAALVYGTIEKDGYWPQDFVVPQGISLQPFKLPVLQKITRHSFGFMLAFRSLEHSSFDFEYRFHILPDRFFLSGAWSIWRDATELSGGLEAVHNEWRVRAGLYLLPWEAPVFRVFVSTGISFTLSDAFKSRFLADPLILGLEYHFSHLAFIAEYRFPFVLGYSRSSFGSAALNMDSFLSIGVQLKW